MQFKYPAYTADIYDYYLNFSYARTPSISGHKTHFLDCSDRIITLINNALVDLLSVVIAIGSVRLCLL